MVGGDATAFSVAMPRDSSSPKDEAQLPCEPGPQMFLAIPENARQPGMDF